MAKTILILEDEEIVQRLLKRLLRSMDCELIPCQTVGEARRILSKRPVDLLISDLKLPDGYGVEIVVYYQHRFPKNKTILLTAQFPNDDEWSRLWRVDESRLTWVSKPFDTEKFLNYVREAVLESAGSAG